MHCFAISHHKENIEHDENVFLRIIEFEDTFLDGLEFQKKHTSI